jgi:DNA-binding winged helix-turn-helix (wHTH) protein
MAEGRSSDAIYEFGDFRFHAAQRQLTARGDGRPIELTPKALDTLHFLLQHPGELLDKSTLIAAVWPSVVVKENSLNQVVSALRRALGDGSGGRRFIVTVPGRGYQFVAPVRRVSDAPPSAPERATAPPPPARRSIAALAFASLSSDPEKDYFGDGIAEELIHLLARIPDLKVPARTASFAYKGRNVSRPLWMPELLAFRRDERFQDFVRDLGFIDYWREPGPPEGWQLKSERLLLP